MDFIYTIGAIARNIVEIIATVKPNITTSSVDVDLKVLSKFSLMDLATLIIVVMVCISKFYIVIATRSHFLTDNAHLQKSSLTFWLAFTIRSTSKANVVEETCWIFTGIYQKL